MIMAVGEENYGRLGPINEDPQNGIIHFHLTGEAQTITTPHRKECAMYYHRDERHC